MMNKVQGFTLFELLAVIAVISFLVTWFSQGLISAYLENKRQVAMEQAYSDLAVLEVIRRSSNTDSTINNAKKSDVISALGEDYGKRLSPLRDQAAGDHVQIGESKYTLNEHYSEVALTLASSFGETEDITISYREKDPLIYQYLALPWLNKRRFSN